MNALTATTLARGYWSRAAQVRAGSVHGEALAQRYETIARTLETEPQRCDVDDNGYVIIVG